MLVEYLKIGVPDRQDSFSKVALGGRQYLIRFAYNAQADRWSFGLYLPDRTPIIRGVRIVPKCPLADFVADDRMPPGAFGVYTSLGEVGRRDFAEGRAAFAYIPFAQGGAA
jgi:hypothetical protein